MLSSAQQKQEEVAVVGGYVIGVTDMITNSTMWCCCWPPFCNSMKLSAAFAFEPATQDARAQFLNCLLQAAEAPPGGPPAEILS